MHNCVHFLKKNIFLRDITKSFIRKSYFHNVFSCANSYLYDSSCDSLSLLLLIIIINNNQYYYFVITRVFSRLNLILIVSIIEVFFIISSTIKFCDVCCRVVFLQLIIQQYVLSIKLASFRYSSQAYTRYNTKFQTNFF